MKVEAYMILIADCMYWFYISRRSIHVRIKVDLVEDDIRLVLNEHNSHLITYEVSPGVYCLKDLSEVLSRDLQNDLFANHS